MRQNYISSAFCLLLGIVLMATPGAAAQPGAADIKLPVPRTFDLTHVEPAHYAVALGKDPVKIFEFVRDQIGYEVYTGALRGPRGMLLAMAGNSVDRAALLASLLEQSGQKVRYVRGKLPQAEAKKLVESMWVERVRPAPAGGEDEPPAALKAALDTLVAGVKRDYALIREHLKKANVTPSAAPAPGFDSLVQEAQAHYWIQWWKDDAWVDLDPSFPDAAPGRRYAPPASPPLDALPDALFHRVTVRVRLEEYPVLNTGNAEGRPSSREILSYTAKAVELSGVDLLLSHQPEKWRGPATSIQAAIASAIENTGRVKPVLLLGEQKWVVGEAFRQKPPTGAGIGSITDLLSGAGTREPVPVATAETIEFDFISPGGRKETVVREVFDVVGKARRATGPNLTQDEVRKRTKAPEVFDVTKALYNLFFATGRIDTGHVPAVVQGEAIQPDERPDVRAILRRMNVAFTIVSDSLLRRIGRPETAVVAFYPDSPRLQIMEMSKAVNATRFSLDLRRPDERSIIMGPHPEAIVNARILKGVLQGTLERVVVESGIGDRGRGRGLQASVSTSALFERATAEQIPILILPRDLGQLQEPPADALARLREETAAGTVVALAPRRAVNIAGLPRLAWWRIDSRTGDTVAVTDDGLHQEYIMVHREGSVVTALDAGLEVTTVDFVSAQIAADWVSTLLQLGARYSFLPFFPWVM